MWWCLVVVGVGPTIGAWPGWSGSGTAMMGRTEQRENAADVESPRLGRPPEAGVGERRGWEMLRVEVVDATGRLTREGVAWLGAGLAGAGELLGAAGEARVRLVADAEMARVHEERLGIAGTTDVITFDLREEKPGTGSQTPGEGAEIGGVGGGGKGVVVDVDVLICLDEAERQAARRGIEARSETLLYAIHGLLHCLGHDDRDEAGSAAMHGVEDRTLVALGLGPIYSSVEGSGGAGSGVGSQGGEG